MGSCLAEDSHAVVHVDLDDRLVAAFDDLVPRAGAGRPRRDAGGDRPRAATDYNPVSDTDVTLLALPTPASADGSVDTAILGSATETLGKALAARDDSHLVVVESTGRVVASDPVVIDGRRTMERPEGITW